MYRCFRTLEFPGHMTQRGFSLYVWKIEHPKQGTLLYVGRTGDSSSPNASSPIRRMGQHFHPVNRGNTLYRYLTSEKYGVEPESCTSFKLFSYGPFFQEVMPEAGDPEDQAEARRVMMHRHSPLRDVVAGLERALADTLRCVKYEVMNPVNGRSDTESHLWHEVLAAFEPHLPKLRRVLQEYPCRPDCASQGGMPSLTPEAP